LIIQVDFKNKIYSIVTGCMTEDVFNVSKRIVLLLI